MKTNYLFPILALVVTLMSLVVLSGCQPEQTAVAAALTNSAAPQAVFNPEVRAYEQYRTQRTAAAEAVSFHAIDPVDMKLFNYVETSMDSADLSAYRWNAMARGYERLGLLNDNLDAGDVSAYRWHAMAKAYERMGMLNVSQHSGFTNNESSAIYAIDSVDLKLFNALQSAPSIMRAHQAGTVYAIHPVDLKLFDAAGNAPAAVAGE